MLDFWSFASSLSVSKNKNHLEEKRKQTFTEIQSPGCRADEADGSGLSRWQWLAASTLPVPWHPAQSSISHGTHSTNIGEMTDSWNNRISENTKSSLSTFLEINDFSVVFEQKNVLNNFYEIKFHKIRFSTCQTGQN